MDLTDHCPSSSGGRGGLKIKTVLSVFPDTTATLQLESCKSKFPAGCRRGPLPNHGPMFPQPLTTIPHTALQRTGASLVTGTRAATGAAWRYWLSDESRVVAAAHSFVPH